MQKAAMQTTTLLLLAFLCKLSHGTADIREPPGVKEPSPDEIPMRYFKSGASFTLPCVATGKPAPEYTWYLNGEVLDLNLDRIQKNQDGYITIMHATLFEDGDYQCVASNQWGKSLSQVFHLRRASIGSFPADKKITPFYGKVGEPKKINRISIKSVPKPSFTWKKVDNVDDKYPDQVVRSRRILQDKDGNLYFTSLMESDALDDTHFYKVDVFNNVLDTISGGSYSKLHVEPGTGDSQALKLLYPETTPYTVTVVEGKELKIQCIFGGHHDISVSWAGPATKFELDEFGTMLKVRVVSQADEGRYTCTGSTPQSDGRPSLTAHIDVDVQTPPKFSSKGKPHMQTLSEEDTVTFTCQTTEDTEPAASVQWLINTEPIDERVPGPRTEVGHIENGKTLKIVNLKREDIKVIQCNISNEHKTLYADAPLNVLLRTGLTSTPKDQVIESNSTQVVFNCTATSDPSTRIALNWTRDGKFIGYYDDPNMVEDHGLLRINFNGMTPEEIAEYAGDYCCNASNTYSYDFHMVKLTYYSGDGKTDERKDGRSWLWLIILMIVLFLLLLIIFLFCCVCLQRNKGDSYPVDLKERANGNDPVAELDTAGFHDYQRPPVAKRKDSRASLTSTVVMGSVAGDSLDEFGDFNEGGISEDGSFIGNYTFDRKKLKLSSSEA